MIPQATLVVDEIERLFSAKGDEAYGEQVTLLEHMLLTAQTAERAGATNELIAACLLHDVGHLLVEPDDEYGKHSHEEIGAEWVAGRFPAAVSEPVRQHVNAKRYLCAVEPGYHQQLSPASRYTMAKQGGPMSPEEIEAFEELQHYQDALALRRWEDACGKKEDTEMPPFSRYRPLLESLVTA